MINLYDLMIGDFPISQGFGERPDQYAWIKDINGNPIKGHNGVDVATPTGTLLLNPFPKDSNITVSAVGLDPAGYGNYVRVWDKTQGAVILYAHCQEINVKVGDVLYFQQQVAVSDNTGWSTGAHCHIGFYLVDNVGNKLNRDNGFDGYLNILDPQQARFTILEPKVPASPPVPVTPGNQAVISIPISTHEKLVTNSDNYQRVIEYVGLTTQANDTPSKSVTDVIDGYKKQIEDLKNQLSQAGGSSVVDKQELQNKDEEVHRLQQQLIDEEKHHAEELKNIPTFDSLKTVNDKRYFDLYTKYEAAMKEKGAILNELAGIKGEVVTEINTPLIARIIKAILHVFSL